MLFVNNNSIVYLLFVFSGIISWKTINFLLKFLKKQCYKIYIVDEKHNLFITNQLFNFHTINQLLF